MSQQPTPTATPEQPQNNQKQYRLVLAAARDLTRVESAYHADLLVSALLGSVYSIAERDRGEVVDRFVRGFRQFLTASPAEDPDQVAALLAVLDHLVPPPERTAQTAAAEHPDQPAAAEHPDQPAWICQLDRLALGECWAYGDACGDQVTYLATFDYPDPDQGGPEHVVAILVDRNLGIVKDLFIAAPADIVIDRLRASADDDPAYLVTIPPDRMPGLVTPYLAATDALGVLPGEGTLSTDRAAALARLRRLPATRDDVYGSGARGEVAAADQVIAAFRASAEAERLVGAPGDAAALEFCLDLIQRFVRTRPDHDSLRWSPTAVELFLLDWVPREAILDQTDRRLLPSVLDAWVRWSGRIRQLPPTAVAHTVLAVAGARPRFLARSGDVTLRSPKTRAVAAMLAAGVDLADERAVASWIEAYNADHEPGSEPGSEPARG